tara:strand:- start:152695 stop:153348 length:654 start_codon:yes stop_codon:yes gene_type:complete
MPIGTPTPRPHQLLIAYAGLALLGVSTLVGCSAPKMDWDKKAQPAKDPVEAYNQRSRAKALELFREASKLHEAGEEAKALTKYRESIDADNTLFAAWNNMGQLLMQQQNYADAVAAYKIASDLQTTDPRPDYNIGLAYQTIGWADESYEHFQRSIDRDPNYLPSLRGAVRSAEMLGIGDQQVLEYIRNGQLRETVTEWRTYFDRQRFRVEKLIDETT